MVCYVSERESVSALCTGASSEDALPSTSPMSLGVFSVGAATWLRHYCTNVEPASATDGSPWHGRRGKSVIMYSLVWLNK
jgi:hypothetical protein